MRKRTSIRRFKVVGKPKLLRYSRNGNPVIRIRWRWNGGPVRQITREIFKILQPGDTNPKLRKGLVDVMTVGLSLSPAKSGGIGNVCTDASEGCEEACLDLTGMGFVYQMIHVWRALKTAAFYLARKWFVRTLRAELRVWQNKADALGFVLAVRLNVLSDILWETVAPEIFTEFDRAEFYDYTKHPGRSGQLLPNYWVTFSRSETNHKKCLRELSRGNNVTVVFDTGKTSKAHQKNPEFTLPATWQGFPVISGDESDLRYEDSRGGYVVGLTLKAVSNQQRDTAVASGFAV